MNKNVKSVLAGLATGITAGVALGLSGGGLLPAVLVGVGGAIALAKWAPIFSWDTALIL